MNLHDFCQPFYTGSKKTAGIRGKGAQKEIPEYFMSVALGEMAKVELVFGDDLFRKWFKGDREPTPELWGKTAKSFDEIRFSRTVAVNLNADMLPDLMYVFGIILQEDEVIDKYAFCTALARQFQAIAEGSGSADNIMGIVYRECLDVAEFPEYVKNSLRKYSRLKTLMYSSQERDFDEFLVCNTISTVYVTFRRAPVNKMIENVTLKKLADLDNFQRQLDALIDRYLGCQYVMSSRNFSEFVELTRFQTMWMLPFSNEQALELIDKLEYYSEEPRLKQQFREKLINEYFEGHAEFVTNLLLLKLMLMNFCQLSDVPEKKYLFYEQAYQTLLQRHDADKLAYKRIFKSVTDTSDFTKVFREFCAKSYRLGDHELDEKTFEQYFDKN